MNGPHRLGTWTLPSGNSVDADLMPMRDGVAVLAFAWDSPPPLVPDDETYYKIIIRPAVIRLVQEYTERAGPVVVVTP